MIFRLSWRRTEYIFAFVSAIIPFSIYYSTLCPTVNFIDSGELATVASTLGIAHPTGYPLFTLLGWIFVHLPFGLRPIYQLNLMSAILCALGLFFFFRLLVLILNVFVNDKQPLHHHDKSQVERRSYFSIFIPAVTGTLILGLSETYWSTALSIEVYSLHVILLALVLFLFLRAITYEYLLNDNNRIQGNSYWCGFAYILGLGFSNHMTIVLVGLAFFYLFFVSIYRNIGQVSDSFTRRLQESFNVGTKKFIPLFPWFLLGLSIYLYLPIRAAAGPPLNWGNPIDFEKFFWHITAKQYRVWMFTSWENAIKQFQYFITSLPREFTFYPLILAFLGIWHLLKRRSFLIFTLLLFFGCVLYSINYDIHDIDSYFLLAYFTIAIWSAVGVSVVINFFKNHSRISLICILLISLSSLPIINSFDQVNENQNYLVEQYAKDMLKSIEPNGIIISYQWDYFVSAAYYLQLVENHRPDVVIVDKELLRRSWYFKQLDRHHPWLISSSKKELEEFLIDLYKFEHNLPYNLQSIEYDYAQLIRSIIENNYEDRPIYITPEIETRYTDGYHRLPSGLALQLFRDGDIREPTAPVFNFNKIKREDKYIEGLITQYAQAYLNYANYYHFVGKNIMALEMMEKANQIQPGLAEAEYLKAKILLKKPY